MWLVTHATIGDDIHTTPAPKLISSPTVPIGTSSPSESSANIPVGRRILRPTTKLPSDNAKIENCLPNTSVFPIRRKWNPLNSSSLRHDRRVRLEALVRSKGVFCDK